MKSFFAILLSVLSCSSFSLQKVTIAAAENFSEMTDRNVGVANNIRASLQMALENYKSRLIRKNLEVEFKEFNFTQDDLSVLEATRALVKSGAIGAIGYNTSNRALLAAPIHQKAKIPMISTQATATRLATFESFVHSASVNNNSFAKTLAHVAVTQLKAKRAVSVVAVDCSYCTDLTETFKREFLSMGAVSVEVIPILSEQTDFTDVVAKLKMKKFDVILNPNHKLLASRVISALSKEKIEKPYLFADGWGSLPETLFFKMLHDVPFEGYAVDHWHPLLKSRNSTQFIRDFQSKTGAAPDTLSALWYDAASLMLEALLKTPRPTSLELEKQVNALKDFDGVTGTFSYNRGPVPSKETVLLRAKGNSYSFVSVIPTKVTKRAYAKP